MKKREKKKLAKRVARRSDCSEKFAKLIIAEAERQDIGLPLAFSLFEQESDFEVIYGGDYGPVDGPPLYHIEVTKRNYLREFRPYVSSTHRSNGVGLGQITYTPTSVCIEDYGSLEFKSVEVLKFSKTILSDSDLMQESMPTMEILLEDTEEKY